MLQSYLSFFNASKPPTGTRTWNTTFRDDPTLLNEVFGFHGAENVYMLSKYDEGFHFQRKNVGLPTVIAGRQFLGDGQNLTTDSAEILWLTNSSWAESAPGFRAPVLRSDFRLNESVPSEMGVVPYNSTFWYNGTKVTLEAPFIELGKNWYVRSVSPLDLFGQSFVTLPFNHVIADTQSVVGTPHLPTSGRYSS